MESAARAYGLVYRGGHMVQMAGLERGSCSMPAIIRFFRRVLGEPSVCAMGRVVGGTVRTRTGARKLDFVKVTTSDPPWAGPGRDARS